MLHREILKHNGIKIDGLQVDHIHHNGLDNRKSELRIATPRQNSANQRISIKNKSGYKGVSWSNTNKKWVVFINMFGKSKYVGQSSNKKEAAVMYDNAAKELYKQFAFTNQIGGML